MYTMKPVIARTLLVVGTAAVLGLAVSAQTRPSAPALKWHTDFEAAKKESARTGRPILADFTGSDWCGWCIRLKKEVFKTPQFRTWASRRVVLLEVDFPQDKPQSAAIKKQNAELAKRYQIQGYPTILFLTRKGEVMGRYGYDEGGPQRWTAMADRMIQRAIKDGIKP